MGAQPVTPSGTETSNFKNGMLAIHPKSLFPPSTAGLIVSTRSAKREGHPTLQRWIDMFHLVTFLFAYSNATQDEMAAFIYNEGGTLYSNQRISKHLNDLKITKKKASIEAYQASDPKIQFRVYTYWNRPPPLRIFHVPLQKLIDIDKFGVTLERCN